MNKKNAALLVVVLVIVIAIGVFAYTHLNIGGSDVNVLNANNNTSEVINSSNLDINDSDDSEDAEISNSTDNSDNSSSVSSTDPGDVVHKQVFTVSENETGQNEGMEPGTYVMYYTENDGPLKVEKIS